MYEIMHAMNTKDIPLSLVVPISLPLLLESAGRMEEAIMRNE